MSEEGLALLRGRNLTAHGKLGSSELVEEIVSAARMIAAGFIVLGHHRRALRRGDAVLWLSRGLDPGCSATTAGRLVEKREAALALRREDDER